MEEGLFRAQAIRLFPSLESKSPSYPWFVLLTVMMSTFMVVLDGTIVNVAIPTIMLSFGETISQVVWISTAYLIALSIALAMSGWLTEHFGAKQAFIVGLITFVFSSYLCGVAWNIESLIAFRVIQGVGGGILTPVGMTLFTTEFPKENRTIPLGFYSIAIAAAISLGPAVGGYLIELINWKWIFFINLPIGLVTFLFATAVLKRTYRKEIHAFDKWGLITLTGFLVLLFVGISSGNAPWNAEGWTSKFTLVSFIVSGVCLVLFLAIEFSHPFPIVDLRIFRDRNFLMGNIVLFIFSFTLFGSSFLLPLYMQNGLNYSQIRTGLVLLPLGLSQCFFGALSGWMARKVPPMFLVLCGIIILGITYQYNSEFTLYTSERSMVWLFIVRGAAMGFLFAPLLAITMGKITEEKLSQASGLFTVQRQIGAALGVAVFETIFTNRQVFHTAAVGGKIDTSSPAFEHVNQNIAQTSMADFGHSPIEALATAQQFILEFIQNKVFIQSIGDCLLLAGIITFFSAIPLFFLKKK